MSWLQQSPHRRWNPLKREWVLVSPQRTQRPWQGEVSPAVKPALQHYDPACYLCPGNLRAGGARNPDYHSTFVFDNDYAALLPGGPGLHTEDKLLRAESERGSCRVVCFDPDHSLTLADMPAQAIEKIVEVWQQEYSALRAQGFRYVQIFENRGASMGASNPHPHGQIWATEHIPDEPRREEESLAAYAAEHGSCLLCDYAGIELDRSERMVCKNAYFIAVVPWWAVWPFEILLLPTTHIASIDTMSPEQVASLAAILKDITTRYNSLFHTTFPYTMGFHQDHSSQHAHFHAHFYPPLLRSASVRKFMVGFELLAMPQRDITPESAAERLRQVV